MISQVLIKMGLQFIFICEFTLDCLFFSYLYHGAGKEPVVAAVLAKALY